MIRRYMKKTFRMSARQFERFDRIRRSKRGGFCLWTELIIEALEKYAEECERNFPGKFPPEITPPSLLGPTRDRVSDASQARADVVKPAKLAGVSDKGSSKKQLPGGFKKKRSPVTT